MFDREAYHRHRFWSHDRSTTAVDDSRGNNGPTLDLTYQESQVSIGALARDQSHAETRPSTSTAKRDVEETGGREEDGDLAEEMERMVVDERSDEKAIKGEILVPSGTNEGETHIEKSMEMEAPVFESAEGETPVVFAVGESPRNFEGESLVLVAEGETPRNSEGETPVMSAKGETLRNFEGETSFVYVEGGTRLCLLRGKSWENLWGRKPPLILKFRSPRKEG